MSGTIHIAEDVEWSTNSLVFFWLIELISETVRDDELATVLREISEANLKWLYFDDLDDRGQQVLRRYLTDELMPNAESRLLPRTKERQIVIDRLKELVRLLAWISPLSSSFRFGRRHGAVEALGVPHHRRRRYTGSVVCVPDAHRAPNCLECGTSPHTPDVRGKAGMAEIQIRTERVLRVRSVTPGPGVVAEENGLAMDLSIGTLGDLFWLTLPEMRPILKRMLLEELDDAIEWNRETCDISPFQICSEFCDEILEPALGGMPESIALAQRSCAALGQVVKIYADLNSLLRNAVGIRIFERVILEPMRSQISKIDSELVASIFSIEKSLKR